ncbi:hypothetical protein PYW08_010022 [Mythimna loreyi]|uniref:Uncharacterized protein n=1 Tax=Mythimna loreyi TaxID=667449 RepID=A0ACC2Q5P5_9NEOP|nr:hypothetical protein PYW08_010022 [Mythimna loreyi]
MRRTPPQSPAMSTASDSDTLQVRNTSISVTGSAPNLNIRDTNVTSRNKRKREDEMVGFMQEIRDLLQTATAQSEDKFKSLQDSMNEIKAQNLELKTSLAFVTKKYDDIIIKVNELDRERKTDHAYINQLESKVENLERTLCLTKIEIRNIPKREGENKEDLNGIVSETAKVLGMPVEQHDIKDIFRLNKKTGGSSIIVDFVSVSARENILHKVRNFNRKNAQTKLNTSHINIPGESRPIFISEILTMKAQ